MKINFEFITNSSCASFVIPRRFLSEHQVEQIKNHIEESEKYITHRGPQTQICNDPNDAWNIIVTDDEVSGDTIMDNFDMFWFLTQIGVNNEHIKHEGWNQWKINKNWNRPYIL